MTDYSGQFIKWKAFDEGGFIYSSSVTGQSLYIRLNDFPEESMYTLFMEKTPLIDFDDWPKNWVRPD